MTRGCLLTYSRGTTNVLVVSSTEGMLHRVLSHTTHRGANSFTFDGILVAGTFSLQQWLLSVRPPPATTPIWASREHGSIHFLRLHSERNGMKEISITALAYYIMQSMK